MGGDIVASNLTHFKTISIHSARVGGDYAMQLDCCSIKLFQSTPPVWAETYRATASRLSSSHFNPLRPCGRRLNGSSPFVSTIKFQSTPPVWAETIRHHAAKIQDVISIHSARVGGDNAHRQNADRKNYFNPLRPCGRRPTLILIIRSSISFQSTPPVWAETHAGLDVKNVRCNFNPLRPCGRRHGNASFI